MQLNDSLAMTLLETKFMDDYLAYNSNANIFMSYLLLALTCAFSNISKIVNFRTSIQVSTFFNHYYVEYYHQYDDYDINDFLLPRVQE